MDLIIKELGSDADIKKLISMALNSQQEPFTSKSCFLITLHKEVFDLRVKIFN